VRPLVASLALLFTGCFALARESYTTLEGGTPISPADEVVVKRDRTGHGFAQDAAATRAHGDVVVSICDWQPGFWMFIPIPIPLLSNEETPGLPNTTLVRVTFESEGPWRARFDELALIGEGGVRNKPIRYRIVLPEKSESLADANPHVTELEPCARAEEPKKTVERAKVAVLDRGELWLLFDTPPEPEEGPRTLELGGLTRADKAVPLPKLALDGGSRWFWYRVFP
jgi:hypothetical protein